MHLTNEISRGCRGKYYDEIMFLATGRDIREKLRLALFGSEGDTIRMS